jgi:methionyl-tRNA formyltransferase
VKIVFFTAGGPFGLRALESLRTDHEIVAVVRPTDTAPAWKRVARVPARWLRLRHRDVVKDALRGTALRSVDAVRGEDGALATELAHLRPDLICVATFPWLLEREVLEIPRHGVVNLHPSYLPRHRGPNPLFWTYYHDDRTGGVSAHMASAHADAGPILLQERIDIPRGWSSSHLYLAAATVGAELLLSAVESIERGTARPVPQAERLSTQAPRLQNGTPMMDFASWDVERAWHFLAGLNPWYKEPLTTPEGRPVRYGRVMGFDRRASNGRTGHARAAANGWALTCRGGEVLLGRRSMMPTRVSEDPGAARARGAF